MDRKESVEMELDWEVIEEQARKYDEGDRSAIALRAKMLEIAYFEGYNQCAEDQDHVANNFAIMMSQPAGNA